VTTLRAISTVAAAGLLAAATAVRAQAGPPGSHADLTGLQEIRKETQALFRIANNSLLRVEVTQSAAAVLDSSPGLKSEFDAWLKSGNGPAGSFGQQPPNQGRGAGRGGPGDRDGRGPRPGGRGDGRGDGGNPPGFAGMRGFGLHNQVRQFLESKADRATDPADAARYRALALRVDLSRSGFQGDLSAILLSADGYALLPTGLLREAHANNPSSLKAELPDGSQTTAKFVGSNLFGGYTIIRFDKPTGAAPAPWAKSRLMAGDFLLAVGASQGGSGYLVAGGRPGTPVIDRFPASFDDRNGAFLFDTNGQLAAVMTGGSGWGGGDRLALTAARMQREVDYIIKTGRDIEPKQFGISYKNLDQDPARAAKVASVLGSRRAVIVEKVEPDSPAAKAGLKPNDIVVSIDARPVTEYRQVQIDLATRGGTIPVGILRDDATEQVLEMTITPPPVTPTGM
jgi:S1-C subfamily serine protease